MAAYAQTDSLKKDTAQIKQIPENTTQADPTELSSSSQAKPKHIKSPRKAMLFSMVVPGLGQVYNRKYWKVPIVYAAMGTTIYFFKENDKDYKEFKRAYIIKIDTIKSTIDNYPKLSADDLMTYQKTYKKYRDLNAILTVLMYALNIADAYVDAHLTTFDVSDKLSMKVEPTIHFSAFDRKPSGVISLSFKF